MTGDHPSLRDPMAMGALHPATQNEGERRPCKAAKADDSVFIVIGDSLIVLHKKFHFLNDIVVTTLKRFDRACLPPLENLTIYETNLRASCDFHLLLS
ncbi:hypothetical protein IEQ34_022526 [Dendrobium chrysotoxum]|uniref:Uncharacterized protein n=1 Tax=Dendrobium chrysotoxum TaxID=161865 RepID=A0AAV7FXC8_DENCH|nr:hypothetical protein IEQ34_022526 [Dendrobium chrysotoxum]